MTAHARPVPWFLWPLIFPFRLVEWILKLTGRLLGAILGTTLVAVGIILILTVAGAILGVPFIILGFLLMVRSIF